MLQSALEERANNHGHQTQCCRVASHSIAALGVIGAEVSVAARLGFGRPYPTRGETFLLTASGHGDVPKKGVTWNRQIGEGEKREKEMVKEGADSWRWEMLAICKGKELNVKCL